MGKLTSVSNSHEAQRLQAVATDPDYAAFVKSYTYGDVATFENFGILSPEMRDLVLGALCPDSKKRITMQTIAHFLVDDDIIYVYLIDFGFLSLALVLVMSNRNGAWATRVALPLFGQCSS
jgi:hypothetical protein